MKKTLSVVLMLLLMIVTAVPCLAEEYKPGDDIRIDVSATYRYSSEPNIYDSGSKNGEYSITSSGGITVTVTPKNSLPDGTRFVVRVVPIADENAYKWFSDCTKDLGENILPFDIFFIDADGNKINVSEIMTIEITLPDSYGTPVVCYLSTDGKTTVLDSKKSDNKVVFATDHTSYYVVAQKSGTVGSPQTGDNSNMILFVVLLLVSSGAMIALGIKYEKKQTRK